MTSLGVLPRRAAATPTCRPRACGRAPCVRVVAFRENSEIKDWRVKQMVETCHAYYSQVWSRGKTNLVDVLVGDAFVHRDLCSPAAWPGRAGGGGGGGGSAGLTVGPHALKALVEDTRSQYPDYHIEVEDVAVSDAQRVFVSWAAHGTQLGAPPQVAPSPAAPRRAAAAGSSSSSSSAAAHSSASPSASAPPVASFHSSVVRGVDVVAFCPDRSRIVEVNVFRQLSYDERTDAARRGAPSPPNEIRLARLHWDGSEASA